MFPTVIFERFYILRQHRSAKTAHQELLVLMAVTIGGEAFGILGMLFSVPVCAVLFSLYLEFMKKASTH